MSAMRSPNPSLGASGAVFGIVGAYFTFLLRNEDLFGGQAEQMQQNLAGTIGINLIFGFMSPMIDNWGHIGGFIGGIGMAAMFGPRLSFVGLPDGSSAILDEPYLRLPRHFEAIPEQIGNAINGVTSKLQISHYMSDLPMKPWRSKRSQQHRRQTAPNRSIRPLPVS